MSRSVARRNRLLLFLLPTYLDISYSIAAEYME